MSFRGLDEILMDLKARVSQAIHIALIGQNYGSQVVYGPILDRILAISERSNGWTIMFF